MSLRISHPWSSLTTILATAAFIGMIGCAPPEPPVNDCPATRGGNPALHDPASFDTYAAPQWAFWGNDLHNTHHAAAETILSSDNIANLQVAWEFETTGSVTTNPTIDGDVMYFPDWGPALGGILGGLPGGQLYAVNRHTGETIWQKPIRDYNDNDFNNIVRNSPAIAGDLLIFGDVQNATIIVPNDALLDPLGREAAGLTQPCGGFVYAVKRDGPNAGELVWSTRIADHEYDQITQSPVVYGDTVLVGVSSQESAYTKSEKLDCCEFRGSIVALNAHTGVIKWKTFMTREPSPTQRFSGASVWGGAPTVDAKRNAVYVPTGNNYDVPDEYKQCIFAAAGDEVAEAICADMWEDNYFDSIVSLDLDDGSINWVMRSRNYDAWNNACDREILIPLLPGSDANCPDPKGPDADFAQPPMLITVMVDGEPQDRLFAGTKGGVFFAIDPDSGAVIWQRQVGPGGPIGGMEFGSATDGERIYLQNANFVHVPYVLEAGLRAGEEIRGGFWAALDPLDGSIIWETPVPTIDLPFESNCEPELVAQWGINVCLHPVQGVNKGPAFWAWPIAPLTVANGLVFAGVSDLDGTMVAMDASSGQILWEYKSGASIGGAPTVVDGSVYWGIGYKYGVEGEKLIRFSLPE